VKSRQGSIAKEKSKEGMEGPGKGYPSLFPGVSAQWQLFSEGREYRGEGGMEKLSDCVWRDWWVSTNLASQRPGIRC